MLRKRTPDSTQLFFDNEKPIIFIEFMGAKTDLDEYDGQTNYVPRGKIAIRLDEITAYYDHTIITREKRISVMDTYEEIKERIRRI